jgi:hypothetical protein
MIQALTPHDNSDDDDDDDLGVKHTRRIKKLTTQYNNK